MGASRRALPASVSDRSPEGRDARSARGSMAQPRERGRVSGDAQQVALTFCIRLRSQSSER